MNIIDLDEILVDPTEDLHEVSLTLSVPAAMEIFGIDDILEMMEQLQMNEEKEVPPDIQATLSSTILMFGQMWNINCLYITLPENFENTDEFIESQKGADPKDGSIVVSLTPGIKVQEE